MTSDEVKAMNPIVLIVSESKHRASGAPRSERCDGYLKDTGERLLFGSARPLRDAAKIMLERSTDPDVVIAYAWASKPDVIAMFGTVGAAAAMGEKDIET